MAKSKSQFAQRLKRAKSQWQAAPVGGFQTCPVGRHVFTLETAELQESKSSQELQIFLNWAVSRGEDKGIHLGEWLGLENEKRMPMTKERIESIGYEIPDDPSDIEELVAELKKDPPTIIADVIHRNDQNGEVRANLRNVQVLNDENDIEEEEEEEETEENDEIEEEEEEEENDENDEIEVGLTVKFTDDDDNEIIGEVVEIDDDEATVTDEDGGKWQVDVSDLTVTSDSSEEEEEEEEEEVDPEEEAKQALSAIAEAHDVAFDEDDDLADLVKTLKKQKWKHDELTADEIAVLKENGIKVEKKPAGKKPAGKKPAGKKDKKKKGRR